MTYREFRIGQVSGSHSGFTVPTQKQIDESRKQTRELVNSIMRRPDINSNRMKKLPIELELTEADLLNEDIV